ncbi:hypothetical protein B0H14DRAFT_3870748 [Mycena olivaceomarginata]|nr:hypothetical protein B0H14DRAFT_3870748 [Mycena olivaceomarginata]
MRHAAHPLSRPPLHPPPGAAIAAAYADIRRTANTVLHTRPDTRHARPTGRGAAHPRSSRILARHSVSETGRAPTDIPSSATVFPHPRPSQPTVLHTSGSTSPSPPPATRCPALAPRRREAARRSHTPGRIRHSPLVSASLSFIPLLRRAPRR